MQDNALIRKILAIINANTAAVGISVLAVKQGYQPTLQGANTGPTAYLWKVGDVPRGWPRKNDEWNVTLGKMVHTETQAYETTFQIDALVTQDPKTPDAKTASDVVNLLRAIIQSAPSMESLESDGIGLLRPESVRNPYFKDDRDQFEAAPSFDFTLTHKQVIVSETPVVDTTELQILTV